MRRKAAVAGYFYPGSGHALRAMIERMVDPHVPKQRAISVISPHAGFEYSGPVAGAVFSSVELPETFVILGPSHRGIRSKFGIMAEGSWETPLGNVPIETHLAASLKESLALIADDLLGHAQEHSLEVQVPFIQYFKESFSLVPICISPHVSFKELEDLGRAIASAIQKFSRDVLIVASTDMSHYVSQEEAREKDFLAINRVLALDAKGLHDTVRKEDISMCGFQPTTAAIIAAKELGASRAELIKYQTSGDRTGNYREVVGYAGIRIS
jgi:AmmeMemoRadiSam system protein B